MQSHNGALLPQKRIYHDAIITEIITTKPAADTELTVSSSPEEPVTIQEPGVYPAISEHEFRDRPIEVIAVNYLRINHIIEIKAVQNRQQDDNVQSAELHFMLEHETLIKETTANLDLIDVQFCLEVNKLQQIPEDYKQVAKRLTHGWGITMVNDRIIIPKSLRYAALNAVHFGHPGIKKMCSDGPMLWWPNMGADIEENAKTCSTFLNAGKNLKPKIPSTERASIEPTEIRGKKSELISLETKQ